MNKPAAFWWNIKASLIRVFVCVNLQSCLLSGYNRRRVELPPPTVTETFVKIKLGSSQESAPLSESLLLQVSARVNQVILFGPRLLTRLVSEDCDTSAVRVAGEIFIQYHSQIHFRPTVNHFWDQLLSCVRQRSVVALINDSVPHSEVLKLQEFQSQVS